MSRQMKILLVGDVLGSYRSHLLLKTLLDNGYTVGLAGDRYFRLITDDAHTLIHRIFVTISLCFAALLFCFELLVKAPFASVIYLLPMNHQLFILVFIIKVLFRKKLVTDLYISLYDTCRDRGVYKKANSMRARIHKIIDRWIIEKSDIVVHQSLHELVYIANLVNAKVNHDKIRIFPLAVEPYARAVLEDRQRKEFRICWWGTFIPLHGLDRIIQAIKILKEKGVKVRLDLFGVPNPEARRYQKLQSEKVFKDCLFY